MPLAMEEKRAMVGHPPGCPTASTPLGGILMGAAGLRDVRGRGLLWGGMQDTKPRESRGLILLPGEQLA